MVEVIVAATFEVPRMDMASVAATLRAMVFLCTSTRFDDGGTNAKRLSEVPDKLRDLSWKPPLLFLVVVLKGISGGWWGLVGILFLNRPP